MKKFQAKRLLKLIEKLKETKEEEFYMGYWKVDDIKKTCAKELKPNSCGTVCCDAGLACSIPSFRKAGLKLVKYYYPQIDGEYYPSFNNMEHSHIKKSLEDFFGDSSIFFPAYYQKPTHKITPIDVIEYIKQIIRYDYPELVK